jgi:hypothetical protein
VTRYLSAAGTYSEYRSAHHRARRRQYRIGDLIRKDLVFRIDAPPRMKVPRSSGHPTSSIRVDMGRPVLEDAHEALVAKVPGDHVFEHERDTEVRDCGADRIAHGAGGFITGSDFLMEGGVTAAYWFGELAPR